MWISRDQVNLMTTENCKHFCSCAKVGENITCMQSCSQCNELPLNTKLLTSHTNFFFNNAEYNQVGSFFFCADFDLCRFCWAEMSLADFVAPKCHKWFLVVAYIVAI